MFFQIISRLMPMFLQFNKRFRHLKKPWIKRECDEPTGCQGRIRNLPAIGGRNVSKHEALANAAHLAMVEAALKQQAQAAGISGEIRLAPSDTKRWNSA